MLQLLPGTLFAIQCVFFGDGNRSVSPRRRVLRPSHSVEIGALLPSCERIVIGLLRLSTAKEGAEFALLRLLISRGRHKSRQTWYARSPLPQLRLVLEFVLQLIRPQLPHSARHLSLGFACLMQPSVRNQPRGTMWDIVAKAWSISIPWVVITKWEYHDDVGYFTMWDD